MSSALAMVELPPVITVGEKQYQTDMLLPSTQIQDRVDQMGRELSERYNDRGNVHVLAVMNGALHFASDLRRSMQGVNPELEITSDQIRISSYTGMQSSGVLRFQGPSPEDLDGRHVLVVEDILDTGLTLDWLVKYLRGQGPASVEVATAIRKDNPDRRTNLGDVAVHAGFDIGNDFVIGYGLDIDQRYRDLSSIHTLAEIV